MSSNKSVFKNLILLLTSTFCLASCSFGGVNDKPENNEQEQQEHHEQEHHEEEHEEEHHEEEQHEEEHEEKVIQDVKFVEINSSLTKVIDGIRNISLTFDKIISNETDLVNLEKTEVGNYFKLGNELLSNISGASISCLKGSTDLLITIPERISIQDRTVLKIAQGCLIGDFRLPSVRIVFENEIWSNYKYFYISTDESLTIEKGDGYSIKVINHFTTGLENTIDEKPYTAGTYFIRKSSYDSSKCNSISEYLSKYGPAKKSYMNVPLEQSPTLVGSEYVFESTLNIGVDDYETDFIPVGYIKCGLDLMIGQQGSYYSSLIKEAAKTPFDYKELFPEYCEFSISTSSSCEIVKSDSKYNLRFANTITMTEGYSFDNYKYNCGTILVDKIKYESSGCVSIEEYISKHDSELIKQDSSDDVVVVNDIIQFTSSVNIPKESYNTSFIPVGYLSINNKVYYGQKGTYSCSLFDEAKKSIRNYPDLFMDHYTIEVDTNKLPSINKNDSKYSLKFDTEISVNEDGDINSINYESGTILINKKHYSSSGLTSFESYINMYAPSTSGNIGTYRKLVNSKNLENKDQKYSISGEFVISSGNYKTDFIAVGYLKVCDLYIFGQSPTSYEFTSLYSEALKTPLNYPDICTEYFVLSLKTTNKTFELLDESLNQDLATLSFDKNGFYKLTANENIQEIYLDGKKIENKTLEKGNSTYLSVANGQPKFINESHGSYLGFAEPNREIWRDSNSNPNLNSYTNNAKVFSEMNGECARIWISPATLYYGLKGAHPIFYNTGFSDAIQQESVDEINKTIAAYRKAGIKEIILLVNGMYFCNDDYMVVHKDSDPTTKVMLNGHEQYIEIQKIQNNSSLNNDQKNALISEFHMRQLFPIVNYDVFLENNKKFYTMLANLFDVDYMECTNEINLEPFKYDVAYYEHEYEPVYNPNGQEITSIPLQDQYEIRDRVIKNVADFCKTMTDGILNSNRKNIRVLTPAMSGVNDSPRDDKWAKPTLRSAYYFFDGMYDYIINDKKASVSSYFQGLNMHPYLFHGYDTPYNDCYLFWNSTKQNSDINDDNFNNNFDTDWTNYMNSFHDLSVSYDDPYVSIFATEVGYTDYADSESKKWQGYGDSKYLPLVTNKIIPVAKSLNYLAGIYWFRLYSFDKGSTDGGEANFGFISKTQTLKNWGKDLFKQFTGSSDTTKFEQVIASLDNTIPENYY